ncbi:MAG: radical SAM protein [Candidatus Aenigmatarchaeota archaeon]
MYEEKIKGLQETNCYLALNPDCSLKYAEYACVYDKKRDALYKINDDTLDFLIKYQNISVSDIESASTEVKEFITYLLDEQIFVPTQTPFRERIFSVGAKFRPSLPSLRYLLVHLTKDCNLRCRHCYVAPNSNEFLAFDDVEDMLNQMQEMQGFNILLSGGEPLCYPFFYDLNDRLPKYDLRFELLSNGTLITQDVAKMLNVHHVQISIDGMEESHDFMRGRGSFKKAVQGIENLLEAGKEVSISTMVYRKNINEFDEIQHLLDDYGIQQWIINQPSFAGRWRDNADLRVSMEDAARIMINYSRGEGPHKSETNFTCGSHIAAVMPDGGIYPCPFLNTKDMLMGTVSETGLRNAWKNRKGTTILELKECEPCEDFYKCKGGCRYRAKEEGNVCGKDPVMCIIYRKGNESGAMPKDKSFINKPTL